MSFTTTWRTKCNIIEIDCSEIINGDDFAELFIKLHNNPLWSDSYVYLFRAEHVQKLTLGAVDYFKIGHLLHIMFPEKTGQIIVVAKEKLVRIGFEALLIVAQSALKYYKIFSSFSRVERYLGIHLERDC